MALYPTLKSKRTGRIGALAVAIVGGVLWFVLMTTNSSSIPVWIFAWLLVPLGPAVVQVLMFISVLISIFLSNSVGFVVVPVLVGAIFGLIFYLQAGLAARFLRWLRHRREAEQS